MNARNEKQAEEVLGLLNSWWQRRNATNEAFNEGTS
jgi:hypothetical protein